MNITAAEVLILALVAALFYLNHRITTLEQERDIDGNYFEWWLRSMEARKQDKDSDHNHDFSECEDD